MTSLHPVSTCAVYTPQNLALISSVFVLTTGPQYKNTWQGLTPLEPQSRLGTNSLKFEWFVPTYGTAVLKELKRSPMFFDHRAQIQPAVHGARRCRPGVGDA